MQHQAFRLVLVATYDVSVFRAKASKTIGNISKTTTSKLSFGRPGGRNFEMLVVLGDGFDFNRITEHPTFAQQSNLKKSVLGPTCGSPV